MLAEVICLEQGAYYLHMFCPVPLPAENPIVSCLTKIQTGFTFLLPAYPGCPGKEAVTWVFSLMSGN